MPTAVSISKGSAFNAEGMLISPSKQGEGHGTALMGDLIDTGRLIGVEEIRLRAEQIGRYAWIKMGFLPMADAWMQMKREALSFILDGHDRHLGARADELLRRVHGGGPDTAECWPGLRIQSRSFATFRAGSSPGRYHSAGRFLEAASGAPWLAVRKYFGHRSVFLNLKVFPTIFSAAKASLAQW